MVAKSDATKSFVLGSIQGLGIIAMDVITSTRLLSHVKLSGSMFWTMLLL